MQYDDFEPEQRTTERSSWVWWTAGTIVAAAAVATVVYLQFGAAPSLPVPKPAALPVPPPAPASAPAPAPTPPPPVAAAPETPLPALDDSDKPVLGASMALLGEGPVQQFLVPDQLIRHFVATVDNLPRERVPMQTRPLNPTPGQFMVAGSESARVLDPANYARYRPLISLVESTDTAALIGLYRRFYPLLDEAYQSLGNGDGDFNARLAAVIDHLLAAPELEGPVALEQPNVLYTYADPALEARSAGQKLMMRLGRDNELALKRKLREIRAALP